MGAFANHTSRILARTREYLDAPVFIWKAAEVPCVPSNARRGTMFVLGGVEVEVLFSLHVELSEFLTVDSTLVTVDSTLWTSDNDMPHPVAGRHTLEYRDKEYRILAVTESADQVYYILDLGDPNR